MSLGAKPGLDPRVETLGLKPKVLARLRAVGGDAEFGRLITIGVPLLWPVYLALLFPISFCGIGVKAMAAGLKPGVRPAGSHPASVDILGGVSVFAVGLVMLVLLAWWIWSNSIEWRFFEHGVVRARRGVDRARLAYLDVVALTYKLTRRYHNGIYVGTTGTIRIETERGSTAKAVRYQFRHREKSKGLLKRQFEGIDPMDFVRETVAEAVAERLAMEIAEKGSAPWTGSVTFTKAGLSVKKLLGGIVVLPYETIDRMSSNAGTLSLFQKGENGSAASVAVNGRNFYPGLVLLRRLLTPRKAEEEDEAVEEFMDED